MIQNCIKYISSNFPSDQAKNDAKRLSHSEGKHNPNTVDPGTRKIREKRKVDIDRDEGQDDQGENKHVAKKPKVCIRISHIAWTTVQLL